MRKTFILAGLAVAVSFLLAGSAKAFTAQAEENVIIAKDQTVDSTAYLAGSKLIVDGSVHGDLYCAGQNVLISGTVHGDVLCAAQQVTIKGVVHGDIRVAAQMIQLEGVIDGSVSLVGQSITTLPTATIGRDVTAFAETVSLAGKIGRDVTIGAEKILLTSDIQRNAELFGKDISLPSGKLNGNLSYTSDQPASFGQGVVHGRVEQKMPQHHEPPQDNLFLRYIAGPSYWFAAFVLIGIVLLVLTPKLLATTDHAIQVHPLRSLGAGALSLVFGPLLVVLFAVSAVGLPLAVLLGALWLSALFAAPVFSGYTLGQLLTKQQKGWNKNWWQKVLSCTLGLLLIMVLAVIPFVGGFALLLALLWGLGGITLAACRLGGVRKRPKTA